MNAKELIKRLQTMRGDTPVCIRCEGHIIEISSIEVDDKQYLKPEEDKYTEKPQEVIILE